MTTTTKPTAGAVRAADALCTYLSDWVTLAPKGKNDVAEIIDRETGCGDMLEALELAESTLSAMYRIVHAIAPKSCTNDDPNRNWVLARIQAAIRRARGGE